MNKNAFDFLPSKIKKELQSDVSKQLDLNSKANDLLAKLEINRPQNKPTAQFIEPKASSSSPASAFALNNVEDDPSSSKKVKYSLDDKSMTTWEKLVANEKYMMK